MLAVILLHFTQNFSGEFLGIAEEVRSVRLVLEVGVAVAVVAFWGWRTLRRDRPLESPATDRETENPPADRGPERAK